MKSNDVEDAMLEKDAEEELDEEELDEDELDEEELDEEEDELDEEDGKLDEEDDELDELDEEDEKVDEAEFDKESPSSTIVGGFFDEVVTVSDNSIGFIQIACFSSPSHAVFFSLKVSRERARHSASSGPPDSNILEANEIVNMILTID